jgi:hypothetical protein
MTAQILGLTGEQISALRRSTAFQAFQAGPPPQDRISFPLAGSNYSTPLPTEREEAMGACGKLATVCILGVLGCSRKGARKQPNWSS